MLWLFGHHDLALLDTELWLEFIAAEVSTSKLTVAVTRLEEAGTQLDGFREVVAACDDRIPVIAADPRDRNSVVEVLHTALRIPHSSPATEKPATEKEAVG